MNTNIQKIRLGTRKSDLALAQAELVASALRTRFPALEIEIVKKQTVGDKNLTAALAAFGGKGAFVSEFEDALLSGTIDIAVHSAKDLPAVLSGGLVISMTLPREDARDVLVWQNAAVQSAVASGSKAPVIGTASPRRALQVQSLFPSARTALLRGNVPTRLSKLASGEYDAIILAAAGLKRLSLWNGGAASLSDTAPGLVFQPLSFDDMLPAGGQGIIAVECRADDTMTRELLASCCDSASFAELTVERYLITKLGTGCHEPTAVFSCMSGNHLKISICEERAGKPRRKSISGAIPLAGGRYDEAALLSLADALLEKAYA